MTKFWRDGHLRTSSNGLEFWVEGHWVERDDWDRTSTSPLAAIRPRSRSTSATGESTYFAYGSNMDVNQMAERCPGAIQAGVAVLPRHRFLINARGVATIVPDLTERVYGLLWSLSPKHVAALDGFEGVAIGHYQRRYLSVSAHGLPRLALVYVAVNSEPGPPRPGYVEKILVAARGLGLPEEYLAKLEIAG